MSALGTTFEPREASTCTDTMCSGKRWLCHSYANRWAWSSNDPTRCRCRSETTSSFGHRLHRAGESFSQSEENEIVEAALTQVLLWDEVKDRLHQDAIDLSLEAQQKLCIARLLPVKPKVILMDEPTSALDPEATEALERLLWELKGEYTILIVTHNMAQARRASEETAFMLLGRMVEHRPTDELFLTPREQETADYIEGRYG